MSFRNRMRAVSLASPTPRRSEEHTSELQSLRHLVCRLLLEKKKAKLASSSNTSIYTTLAGAYPIGGTRSALRARSFLAMPRARTAITSPNRRSCFVVYLLMMWPTPRSTLFPYTTLFRSLYVSGGEGYVDVFQEQDAGRFARVAHTA